MGQSYFEIEKGLEINTALILADLIEPGSTPETDEAVLGSLFMLTSGNAGHYHKKLPGTGTDKWEKMASEDFVFANVDSSWREPALVRDNTLYADIAAAETAANVADTVDGITITLDDRLLISNLTTDNDNVYIVSGISGNWTFTESTNLATPGDTLYIRQGTDAGRAYTFNGTLWVLRNQANLDEEAFMRTFMGKSAPGSELPVYSSTVYITDGDNLQTAIGFLDAQVDTNAQNILALQILIQNIRNESKVSNVTALTIIDSMLVDDIASAKWIVYCEGNLNADASKKAVVEIMATHDGHNNGAGSDATDTDYTLYAKLKMGNLIGLSFNVTVTGAGAGQTFRLEISSTTAVDVSAIRTSLEYAA